jgi:hypothetical protein
MVEVTSGTEIAPSTILVDTKEHLCPLRMEPEMRIPMVRVEDVVMRLADRWSDGKVAPARHLLPLCWALVAVMLLAGCEQPNVPEESPESCARPLIAGRCWEFMGLEGRQVLTITESPSWVFAGTSHDSHPRSEGAFFRLPKGGGGWERISDFDEVFVAPLYVEPDGAPPRLLVALSVHEARDMPPLQRSLDAGRSWVASDEGWPQHDIPLTTSLVAERGSGGRIFAGGQHRIMMSDDAGETWFESPQAGGAFQIYPSPQLNGTVWSVHNNPFGRLILSRSEDRGQSWFHLRSADGSHTVPVPRRLVQGGPREHILWGIGFSIMASEDAGESWSETGQFSWGGDIAVRGSEVIVVAAPSEPAGMPYEERPLVVKSTLDGDSWTEWPVPSEARAPHRLVVTRGGDLLIGTVNGLWRVRETEG